MKSLHKFMGYYEVQKNDDSQRGFSDFIVAICCNTVKSSLSQFQQGAISRWFEAT